MRWSATGGLPPVPPPPRRSWLLPGWAGLAAIAVLLAVACGPQRSTLKSPTTPSAPVTTPSPVALCPGESPDRTVVHFRGPGRSLLAGVEVGDGPAGIVLAHESTGSHCDWWPYAPELVALGYRVLAFDFDGYGASSTGNSDYPRDVAAAARELRALGALRVVLMGASMGGTAVVCMAPRLDPPPAAVVDLSGPSSFESMNAVAAAKSLRAPALFAEGNQDPVANVAPVQAAAASTDKPLVVANTSLHGVALLDPVTGSPQVRDAVQSFLLRVAPPR